MKGWPSIFISKSLKSFSNRFIKNIWRWICFKRENRLDFCPLQLDGR